MRLGFHLEPEENFLPGVCARENQDREVVGRVGMGIACSHSYDSDSLRLTFFFFFFLVTNISLPFFGASFLRF